MITERVLAKYEWKPVYCCHARQVGEGVIELRPVSFSVFGMRVLKLFQHSCHGRENFCIAHAVISLN